jgi:hypothetical protein
LVDERHRSVKCGVDSITVALPRPQLFLLFELLSSLSSLRQSFLVTTEAHAADWTTPLGSPRGGPSLAGSRLESDPVVERKLRKLSESPAETVQQTTMRLAVEKVLVDVDIWGRDLLTSVIGSFGPDFDPAESKLRIEIARLALDHDNERVPLEEKIGSTNRKSPSGASNLEEVLVAVRTAVTLGNLEVTTMRQVSRGGQAGGDDSAPVPLLSYWVLRRGEAASQSEAPMVIKTIEIKSIDR